MEYKNFWTNNLYEGTKNKKNKQKRFEKWKKAIGKHLLQTALREKRTWTKSENVDNQFGQQRRKYSR